MLLEPPPVCAFACLRVLARAVAHPPPPLVPILCPARPTPSRGLPQVCNVVMTLLQWFWSSLILKAIYFKATGDARAKEA